MCHHWIDGVNVVAGVIISPHLQHNISPRSSVTKTPDLFWKKNITRFIKNKKQYSLSNGWLNHGPGKMLLEFPTNLQLEISLLIRAHPQPTLKLPNCYPMPLSLLTVKSFLYPVLPPLCFLLTPNILEHLQILCTCMQCTHTQEEQKSHDHSHMTSYKVTWPSMYTLYLNGLYSTSNAVWYRTNLLEIFNSSFSTGNQLQLCFECVTGLYTPQ